MSADQAVREIRMAETSWQNFQAGLMAFRADLIRKDFEGLEKERLKITAALEMYLDHMIAANRIEAGC